MNQLNVSLQHSITTLAEDGWSHRRIARELDIHREAVGRHLRLACSKPAKVLTGSALDPAAKPAIRLSIFLIFVLLFDAFKSVKSALLILVNVPLGLIGGIFALLLTGIPLSVSASIGFIALFGQAVPNGVVMVRRGSSTVVHEDVFILS